MKVYKSKVDWFFFLPLSYPIFLCVKGFITGSYLMSAITLIILVLIGLMIQKTEYTISENTLNVKSGFLVNKKIDVKTIRKIENTKSIISAPALSRDRILLIYNKFDDIEISPKDKEEFIKHLLVINPNIEVKS
ncbi:hypothetical protein FSS13T_08570 [Flavobacterium saliperosum S13]|uniref:PH domain-containing protein n=2 Tax=Flavobacterium saliperosum TaxID=329186 RepID=A0A1G4VUY1_9FLAO|nr:PH domain-containing protein [Flavobacterium saliperosum]ESU27246.1 hypothetical protein FSS13T_08570 [Flavobacterium saliperosum S13]SCX12332.1 PH domain-containing protein [Flavobacterium saliperosum]